jgi:transcriptional regulator PpsR
VRAFFSPRTSLGDLDAESAAMLIAAASDMALILDAQGIIRDLALHSEELAADLPASGEWVGRPFAATVAEDSVPKVAALLGDAAGNAEPRWRHVNHLGEAGRSVPVLYCAVQVSEEERRVVAFGRDLRPLSHLQQRLMTAQQSLERDYSRLREAETRYRLLFHTYPEAVLVLDLMRRRVVEANPAATRLLGRSAEQILGRAVTALFDAETVLAVQDLLGAVRAGAGAEEPVRAILADNAAEVLVSASLFREESATFFLLRLVPGHGAVRNGVPDAKAKLLKVVERAPDGFVVTDEAGAVITANAAFLEMAQLHSEEQVRGARLDAWIGRSGVELEVLIAHLRQRESVRFFATTLRGASGLATDVEISAVAVKNGGQPCLGFAIRNVGARLAMQPRAARELPRSVEQLTELIGRIALKDLVREATDVIERLCIEAALEMTRDNRASAAELLGLSRQSFYVKLRRYGLGDLAAYGPN